MNSNLIIYFFEFELKFELRNFYFSSSSSPKKTEFFKFKFDFAILVAINCVLKHCIIYHEALAIKVFSSGKQRKWN